MYLLCSLPIYLPKWTGTAADDSDQALTPTEECGNADALENLTQPSSSQLELDSITDVVDGSPFDFTDDFEDFEGSIFGTPFDFAGSGNVTSLASCKLTNEVYSSDWNIIAYEAQRTPYGCPISGNVLSDTQNQCRAGPQQGMLPSPPLTVDEAFEWLPEATDDVCCALQDGISLLLREAVDSDVQPEDLDAWLSTPQLWPCPQLACPKTYNTISSLDNHLKTVHDIVLDFAGEICALPIKEHIECARFSADVEPSIKKNRPRSIKKEGDDNSPVKTVAYGSPKNQNIGDIRETAEDVYLSRLWKALPNCIGFEISPSQRTLPGTY